MAGFSPVVLTPERGFEPSLGVEVVIKVLLPVHLAVINMGGRKEELPLCGEPRWEVKGHGVDFLLAFAELKHCESLVGIGWELVPGAFRELEAGIEP